MAVKHFFRDRRFETHLAQALHTYRSYNNCRSLLGEVFLLIFQLRRAYTCCPLRKFVGPFHIFIKSDL